MEFNTCVEVYVRARTRANGTAARVCNGITTTIIIIRLIIYGVWLWCFMYVNGCSERTLANWILLLLLTYCCYYYTFSTDLNNTSSDLLTINTGVLLLDTSTKIFKYCYKQFAGKTVLPTGLTERNDKKVWKKLEWQWIKNSFAKLQTKLQHSCTKYS